MKPPSGWGQLSDVQQEKWLRDRDLVLVRGHMVKRGALTAIGLYETARQIEVLAARRPPCP